MSHARPAKGSPVRSRESDGVALQTDSRPFWAVLQGREIRPWPEWLDGCLECRKGSDFMIALRRAEERHHDRSEEQQVWRTFRPENGADSFADRFGPLAFLDEGRLAPGGRIPRHPARDGELLTYVREGSVS